MIPVVRKKQMQSLDAYMMEQMRIPSRVLMENAAFGITTAIWERFGKTKVLALCGMGNNGGDGFAAARQLEARGCDVRVCLVGKAEALQGEAAENAAYFGSRIFEIVSEGTAEALLTDLSGQVLIDALLGVGLHHEVTGLYKRVIELVNDSGAHIVACDIASGIDADTGQICGAAVLAHETVTFQCAKPGHFLYPGRKHTGELIVKELGTTGEYNIGQIRAAVEGLKLLPREADSHKGSYGRLACVVGSTGFSGAGLMCVAGALRSGAGLVTAGIPACLQPIFSSRLSESMTYALDDTAGHLSEHCIPGLEDLLDGKTAVITGPGIGTSSGAATAVEYMVKHHDIKKVFDADALSLIAEHKEWLAERRGDIVLTPHLGEFSKLCNLTVDEIKNDMLTCAQIFSEKYGITLLLKGPTTLVVNGDRAVFVTAGTPGMARGGSGDVLTGVIGGLMCGGHNGGMSGFAAAVYGAYICGKAGEIAAKDCGVLSMTPADTLANIPLVTRDMVKK
jgi:NAD(P)H-hydrate epimerase